MAFITADLGQMGSPKSLADKNRSDTPQPYPLPMPAYGGYFAPLSQLLPDTGSSNAPYLR